jgi:hypothetical protein
MVEMPTVCETDPPGLGTLGTSICALPNKKLQTIKNNNPDRINVGLVIKK